MSDAAFPHATPSEPAGDDPVAAAIERALEQAGLQAGGASGSEAGQHDEAGQPVDTGQHDQHDD